MLRSKAVGVFFLAAFFSLIFSSRSAFAQNVQEIEIIFDASGSMNDPMGGGTRLEAAKKALTEISEIISPESKVGLRVFGASPVQGPESCKDSKLTMPIEPFKKESMVSQAQALKSYGSTAIGFSLGEASKDFTLSAEKTIILISDGEETCGADPLKVIEALKAKGISIKIHSIGFSATPIAQAQLKALADTTGGTYHEAKDTSGLVDSFKEISKTENMLLAPKHGGEGPNILAASEGARIVSASKEIFANLIDGTEDRVGPFEYHDEVVFSFKNNQPVMFEKFLVPIFKTENGNLGEIKLYGSTDRSDSGYFKIAEFKVENKVAFGSVYQEFKIDPPQPIRYLKVLLGRSAADSSINGTYCEEWKAGGKYLTEEEFQAELAKSPSEINLLSKENGGQFIAGGKAYYEKLIDMHYDNFGDRIDIVPGDEAIFGFKDGKTAVLTKIGAPILEAGNDNAKMIEIFVSEKSPVGPYTQVGTFETANMVFANNPVQEYIFDKPVRAKYLKFKFVENHNQSYVCRLYEVLAVGHLE